MVLPLLVLPPQNTLGEELPDGSWLERYPEVLSQNQGLFRLGVSPVECSA